MLLYRLSNWQVVPYFSLFLSSSLDGSFDEWLPAALVLINQTHLGKVDTVWAGLSRKKKGKQQQTKKSQAEMRFSDGFDHWTCVCLAVKTIAGKQARRNWTDRSSSPHQRVMGLLFLLLLWFFIFYDNSLASEVAWKCDRLAGTDSVPSFTTVSHSS